MRRTLLYLVLLTLTGCAATAEQPAPTAPPSATAAIIAAAPNSPTAAPSAMPHLAPTATTRPSATARPTLTATPAPTADPWASYRQWTMAGLRSRSYGAGEIEMVAIMERLPTFTRWLVAYPSDGLRITAMLNVPSGAGPFPVVILSHGYYPIDVYQTGNGTKLAADYLAQRGFLTLSPDFRSHAGSDDAPNPFRAGHVIDLLNAIPLAQRLPSAQPGKVGLWGHSNGGAITAKALVLSDQIAAAVVYSPASLNITEDYWFRVERATQRGGVIDPIEWPVTPDEAPALYTALSPLPELARAAAPVQIHYGTADETVPRTWPQALYDGLVTAGKPVELFLYPGQPHSLQGQPNLLYLSRIAEFYRAHLAVP